LELRRDLLDEGVSCGRPNWCVEVETEDGFLMRATGYGLASKKQPRVKLRGVPVLVPFLQQPRLTRPSEPCP
jgi:hypothetical protein